MKSDLKKYVVVDTGDAFERPVHILINIEFISTAYKFSYVGIDYHSNNHVFFKRDEVIFETDEPNELLEKYFVEFL